MALEGCAACLKYLMIIWNFVILVAGIAITGVGIWLVVDKSSGQFVDDIIDDNKFSINYSQASDSSLLENMAYAIIVFGAITIVIAFLGYCGAMKESQCMLGTCFVLLFLIFGALVGIGIYLYVEKDNTDFDREKLYPVVRDMLNSAVKNYETDEQSKNFMDAVQTEFRCCGSENGATDYQSISSVTSCNILYYLKPCLEPYYQRVESKIGVKSFYSGKMTVAMAVALGVAGALILAMVLTLILCCSVRRSGSY